MTALAHGPQRGNGTPRSLDRGRQYGTSRSGKEAEVWDWDFAAYLLMRGVPLVNAVRMSRKECSFRFTNRDGEIESMSIEFANSESARFGDAMRRLKKTVYSDRSYQRR